MIHRAFVGDGLLCAWCRKPVFTTLQEDTKACAECNKIEHAMRLVAEERHSQ